MPDITGAVLAGAGARGGFEAGFMAGVLPALEEQGRRPRIFCGTSAGSVNSTLLVSLAHLPAEEAAEELVRQWCAGAAGPLLRSVLMAYPVSAIRYAAGRMHLPVPPASLLDPAAARAVLGRFDGWDDLHRNIRDGRVEALALCATDVDQDRTVVFVETQDDRPLPPPDEDRGIRYVRTEIGLEHVLASADVPLLGFPVQIPGDEPGGSWYVDGGVRLNAPLKPALDLGAERLVVVATDPAARPQAPTSRGVPTALDVIDQVVHVVTGDRLIEDLHTLTQVNRLLGARAGAASPPANSEGRPYRRVPALVGTPVAADDFARLVVAALESGPAWPLVALARLTTRLAGVPGSAGADELSYGLLLKEFTRRTVELGQRQAAVRLAEPDSGWRE
jgi:NTE family protein